MVWSRSVWWAGWRQVGWRQVWSRALTCSRMRGGGRWRGAAGGVAGVDLRADAGGGAVAGGGGGVGAAAGRGGVRGAGGVGSGGGAGRGPPGGREGAAAGAAGRG